MTNKSVSDFVAATMNAVLNSAEHKSLFGSTYKTASLNKTAGEQWCTSCKEVTDFVDGKCVNERNHGDNAKADDNAAQDDSSDENSAMDGSSDESCADDENVSTAFDVAIDGLLTASAALDSLGLEKSASYSLQIASFVSEAKKKEKEKKSDKKSGKKDDKKSGKSSSKGDSNSAKDKGKKDDKKSGKSSSTSSSSSAKKPFPKKDDKSSKKSK